MVTHWKELKDIPDAPLSLFEVRGCIEIHACYVIHQWAHRPLTIGLSVEHLLQAAGCHLIVVCVRHVWPVMLSICVPTTGWM